MVINEDYFTGSVFHDCITVMGWTRMEASRRFYAIKCSVCASDPELFGEGIFETTRESLITRAYKPCGCGRAYRFTQEQYETLVKRKALELNVEFLGWLEGFKTGQSKLLMSCSEGTWTPRAAHFIYKGQIAFNKGKTTKPDHEIIEKFFDSGVFHPDTKFTRSRLYNKWYWKVDCPVCGESGLSQPQHLQRGCRPCACGNYKQKFSYLHGIYDKDTIVAVKFGITRSIALRYKYLSRETIFEVIPIGVWEYDEKHNCVTAERVCISTLECGILSKVEFGDGYTETTSPLNIDKIIKIYEDHGGIRV